MTASPLPRRRPGRLLVVLAAATLLAAPLRAEEEAPADRAALEERLARAEAEGLAAEARAPLHAALAEALLAEGEPYAALGHLEAVVRMRGRPADHVRYAEALLGVARTHLAAPQASSVQVMPYLMDALDAAGRAGEEAAVLPRRRRVEAEAQYWLGDLPAAVATFARTDFEALDPADRLRARALQAHALYTLGRPAEAAAAYEAAGDDRGAAAAWAAAGDGAKALAAYASRLRHTPGDGALLAEARRAARFTGTERPLAEWLATLDGAALPPEDRARWLHARGLLAEALGETAAAADLVLAAAEADPAWADPLLDLGRLRLAGPSGRGRTAEDLAVDAWLEGLRRDPANGRLRAVLWATAGNDYGSAWRSPSALARSLRIQEALVAAGDDSEEAPLALVLANLGNTLRIAGRHEEALQAYDRAHALEPDDPATLSDRGLAYAALGRDAEALADWRAAAALDPSFEAAHQNAARALWRAGRDEEAAAHLTAATRAARATGEGARRYRFLVDRTYRTRRAEALR